jgi:hypothetical protein
MREFPTFPHQFSLQNKKGFPASKQRQSVNKKLSRHSNASQNTFRLKKREKIEGKTQKSVANEMN